MFIINKSKGTHNSPKKKKFTIIDISSHEWYVIKWYKCLVQLDYQYYQLKMRY